MDNKKITIYALPVKKGKTQNMVVGKAYKVKPEQAKRLIAKKVASATKPKNNNDDIV